MAKITHVVIHYTATYADQDLSAADIDRMHRARGWKMIGYHWIVRRDGTVEQGRPESMVGAHVGGQNTGKIGISWIGGLDRATGANKGVDNRTPAQTDALIELIRDLLKRYPGAKVVGHRDLAATQCPGFDVPAWWARVQDETVPPASFVPPGSLGVGEDDTHTVEAGETLWSISRAHGLSVEQLRALNAGAVSTVLRIGDVLRLKAPEGATDPRQIIADIRARLDALETSL